jgi:hypothetical protein
MSSTPDMKHAMPLPSGFKWCGDCQASREAWHQHGDPLEDLSVGELLALVRAAKGYVAGLNLLNGATK